MKNVQKFRFLFMYFSFFKKIRSQMHFQRVVRQLEWKNEIFVLFVLSCTLNEGISQAISNNDIDNDSSFYHVGQPTSGSSFQPVNSIGNSELHNMTEDIKSIDKVANILHELLGKYDNRIRPFYPNISVYVSVSLGGVQLMDVLEEKGELTSIVMLQQTWSDPRLAFEENEEDSSGVEYITVQAEHVREFWIPDTFIDEKRPQGHENTMANDAIIIYRNGTVFRSARLIVNTHCQFQYTDFPFDSQVCSLKIGSHAYRISDVKYGWDEQFAVSVEFPGKSSADTKLVIMSSTHTGKFVVTGSSLTESTPSFNYGKMSRLTFTINLQRAWKPFVTRFYLPMVLFVFVSLGTLFFADYKVALIVNLFNLAFVNIFVAIRSTSSDLPSSSSSCTAYDTYFMLCLCYISIALIVTIVKLVQFNNVPNTRHQGFTVQQQPSASSSSGNAHHFPETLVLRQNRRRSGEHHDIFYPLSTNENTDVFNGREENGGGSGGVGMNNGDAELRQIYRSTSYPVRFSSKWMVAGRKVVKFGGWVWKYLKWILVVMFLLTDFAYFKVHSVQYS